VFSLWLVWALAQTDVVTIAAVGDVMLGSAYPEGSPLPPDDGAHLLDEVTPILTAADLAFGNLEGPLADEGASSKCGKPPRKAKKRKTGGRCYAFRVPTRYGQYLQAAGFDVMSLANNHALDVGPAGRQSTMRVLDELGIGHSGEPGDVAHLEVRGKRVAVIAFATYPHSHNLNNLDDARARIRAEVASNDLVVVSFHGGAEGATRVHVPEGAEMFLDENRGDLRTFTHAAIDEGAALVLGHGPHVVRGLEVYKGRLIAYSLGNFATWGAMNLQGPTGLSLILEVKLAPDGRFVAGRIHPARQDFPGGPHLDPGGAVIAEARRLSQEDFGAAAPLIGDDGAVCPTPAAAPGPAETGPPGWPGATTCGAPGPSSRTP
jgi:poly-gamma-glutamate capsule biosynthesis protein CapA/YwtB (metallophosphatase superfamily)